MMDEKKKVYLGGTVTLHFGAEVETTKEKWEEIKRRSEMRSPQPLTETFFEAELSTEPNNAYDVTEELEECYSDWEDGD